MGEKKKVSCVKPSSSSSTSSSTTSSASSAKLVPAATQQWSWYIGATTTQLEHPTGWLVRVRAVKMPKPKFPISEFLFRLDYRASVRWPAKGGKTAAQRKVVWGKASYKIPLLASKLAAKLRYSIFFLFWSLDRKQNNQQQGWRKRVDVLVEGTVEDIDGRAWGESAVAATINTELSDGKLRL